jgi:hypothetical protein
MTNNRAGGEGMGLKAAATEGHRHHRRRRGNWPRNFTNFGCKERTTMELGHTVKVKIISKIRVISCF